MLNSNQLNIIYFKSVIKRRLADNLPKLHISKQEVLLKAIVDGLGNDSSIKSQHEIIKQ